jgi:hypothetical protein
MATLVGLFYYYLLPLVFLGVLIFVMRKTTKMFQRRMVLDEENSRTLKEILAVLERQASR